MGFFLQDLINGAEQAANNFFHPQQQNQKQAQVKNAVQYAPKMLAPQAQQQWAQQHVSQVPQAPKAIQPNYLRAANQVGSGVGNFLFNGTAKLTNQGLGVIENVGANALGGAQSMINHNHSGDQLINQVKQHVDQQLLAKNKGLFGAGGIYNSSDALHNAKPSDVLTKAGGTGLQALTETFTPAKGVGVLAKEAPLALKAAKGALTGLTAGTAYNAGNQLSNTGKIDPKQLAINAAIGGTIGAATPLAVHAGSAAINASKHAAAIQADNIARQAASKNIPANVEAHTVTQKPGTVLNPDLVAQHEQLGASGHANHIIVTKNADGSFTPATDVGAHQLAAYTNLGATHMPIKEVTPAQLRGVKQGGYVKVPGGSTDQAPQDLKLSHTSAPNRLTQGAKAGKQNLSAEVMKQVQGEHVVRNTQALQETAVKAADGQSLDKTISSAYNALNTKHIGDHEVALAQQAIERADAAGRKEDAINIHDMLSEHLTKQGQTIQAASLLYRLSPQGLLYKAMRDIKKAGTEVTPALEDKLRTLSEGIKSAKGQDAKDLAVAKFHKAVADNIPQGKLQGAVSVWKAGLLSGPITHAGNLLSNATFGGLKKISDAPAAAVDAGLSAFGKTKAGQKLGLTGDRTKTFTVRGIGSGTKQGIGTAKETLMTGIDRRNINGNKYDTHGELNFKNPVIQKIFGDTSNGVFRAMGAGDQPFYYAAAKNSLYDQALAAGKNQGLKGSKLTDFAKNTVANPSQKMAQQAQKDAQYAVLSQDSPVASAITGGLSRLSEKNPLLGAAGSVTVPFTKVPTNFLSETLDYTPVGPIKSILQSIKSAKAGQGIDQRALSEAIGKGATGTGIMVLGSALAGAGLLSGQYPTGDQKEVQRWKAEGIQPNSIKIGNNWISMNYLGPVGMLMQAGKDWNDAAARGDDKAIAALTGFGKSLTGQSFLTGFSGVANALQDPQRFGSNFINQQAGSIVPNWMNQTAQAIDPNQRQADTVPQSIQSRIPGLRQGLNVKQDVYGNPLQTRTDPANMLLNPLRPSNAVTSPTLGEVSRLHNTDVNNKDVQVTPTPVNATISLGNKQTVKLNKDQQYQLQKAVGQETQAQWGKLIQTPQYQAMTDTEKANALNTLRTNASEAATRQFVAKNSLGNYAKAPSAKVSALMNGNADVASLSAKSALGGLTINSKLDKSATDILSKYNAMSADQRKQYVASSNDAQFKLDDAKYKNDKISGKITPVQDVTRRAVLAKEQVGANFSPTVRNLYSLSKSNLATYLNQDPNAQNTVNQLLAYDQALVGAGISSKGKYASGVTTTSRSRSTSTRVRTSTGRATTTKAATKSAISALNKASKSTTSATSALNKKVASTKVTVTKARLPSGKAKGVKLTAYKKVAAAPKISMKRRT